MGFVENSDGLPSFEGIIGMTGFDLHGRVKFSIVESSKYTATFAEKRQRPTFPYSHGNLLSETI